MTMKILLCLFLAVTTVMATSQQRNCTAPRLSSGLILRGGIKRMYRHSEYVVFSCVRNHFLAGRRVMSCRNGTWLGTMPQCMPRRRKVQQVTCPKFPHSYFRNVRVSGSNTVTSFKRFRCRRAGYKLVGQRSIKCLANGKWSGRPPQCLRDISCPPLQIPLNGSRYGQKFKNGRTIRFSCKKGFKLLGSKSRRCKSNRKWTGKVAKCKKIDSMQELRDIADNLRKNLVNKFSLVTMDSRARAGIASGGAGLDFVFVLDSSASVGPSNFRRGIRFVETLIREYGVSTKPQGTRVAIVTFQSTPTVRHNLETNVIQSINQSMQALGNLKFEGGGTDIRKALDKVYHVVLPETRAGTKKVLFLITDGHSNTGSDPRQMAKRLRDKQFEIYTIGITKDADERELESIATQPYRSHIYLLADYATLEKLKDMITGEGIDTFECGTAGDTGLRNKLETPKRGLSRHDAWPWQAAIYVDYQFRCGGALIARNWVLTSVQCFNETRINNLTDYHVEVSSGNYDRIEGEGTEQEIRVIKIIRPNKIPGSPREDLALLKLQHNTKETAFVHKICLDERVDSQLIWPTQYGVISGWGSKTTPGQQTIPVNERVHQSVVKFTSLRACSHGTNYNLNGNVFCGASQDDRVDGCLGDTGGPVMVRTSDDIWMLVGVIKHNEGCLHGNPKVSVFTKVGHHSTWIAQTMRDNL